MGGPRRTAWSSRAEAEALLRRGLELDRAGDYAEADAVLVAATAAARRDPEAAATLAAILVERSALCRFDGRLSDAAGLVDEALGLTEDPGLAGPDGRAEALIEAALVAMEGRDLDAAERRMADASHVLGAAAAEDVPTTLRARHRTTAGRLHRLRGRYPDARLALTEAVALLEASADTPPIDLVEPLNEIGVVGKFSGDFDAAEAAYRRAQAILYEIDPDHPDLGSIEHNLGGLAHARGDLSTAEPHARAAVTIHERTLGSDHLTTVLDRSALAAIVHGLGRDADAEALLLDALPRLESILGPDHPEVAVALNNLAAIDQARGDLASARRRYERTVVIKEAAVGPGSPSLAITLNNLGVLARRQGDRAEAERCFRRAIAILEAAVEPDHPALAAARRNLVRLARGAPGDDVEGHRLASNDNEVLVEGD